MTQYIYGDEEATNEVLFEGRPVRDEKNRSWLRHTFGAAKMDIALLAGATKTDLELLRGSITQHMWHLRKIHNLTVEYDRHAKLYKIKGSYDYENTRRDIEDIENSDLLLTQKKQLIDARVGQGKYRRELILIWASCAITGFSNLALLRASHIKPWCACTNDERLDPYNGFLLSPNYDAVFDKGFITFDGNGCIIFSGSLSGEDYGCLGITPDANIELKDANLSYLDYHRENVFKGNGAA